MLSLQPPPPSHSLPLPHPCKPSIHLHISRGRRKKKEKRHPPKQLRSTNIPIGTATTQPQTPPLISPPTWVSGTKSLATRPSSTRAASASRPTTRSTPTARCTSRTSARSSGCRLRSRARPRRRMRHMVMWVCLMSCWLGLGMRALGRTILCRVRFCCFYFPLLLGGNGLILGETWEKNRWLT